MQIIRCQRQRMTLMFGFVETDEPLALVPPIAAIGPVAAANRHPDDMPTMVAPDHPTLVEGTADAVPAVVAIFVAMMIVIALRDRWCCRRQQAPDHEDRTHDGQKEFPHSHGSCLSPPSPPASKASTSRVAYRPVKVTAFTTSPTLSTQAKAESVYERDCLRCDRSLTYVNSVQNSSGVVLNETCTRYQGGSRENVNAGRAGSGADVAPAPRIALTDQDDAFTVKRAYIPIL